MSKVLTKFKVTKKEVRGSGELITLDVVTCGSFENDMFFEMTPYGNISIGTVNPDAARLFVEGKECKVLFDFNETENGNLTFGDAIKALKQGKRVAREGWNGKGMFIFMRPADEIRVDVVANNIKSLPQTVKDYYLHDCFDMDGKAIEIDESDVVEFTAYLCLKDANGRIVNGWLASQTDILAEDWVILD